MANNIERCSASFAVRKLQIKTTKIYYDTTITMAKIQKKMTIPISGKDMMPQDSYSLLVQIKNDIDTLVDNWELSSKD